MAPAKSAQCICGSIKIWPSSGEEEEASTGRYFVDGFLLTSEDSISYVDFEGEYRDKKYYKTSETTTILGESYPVYLSEDGLYKIKAELVNSTVQLRIYDSSDVYRYITLGKAQGSLTTENLFVDLSEVDYWASTGEDGSITLTELPAPAIKITLTPVRSNSDILAYGNGTYALQENLTTTYGGKTYPVYYCSTNKMYLFVSSGNDTNLIASAYNYLLTPGNIYLVMKLNESADVWRWSDLGAAPTSFAFLRTSYLSYLNDTSWIDFVDDQGETEGFDNWGGLSVKTIELSLSSDGSSSESGSNIKLQGFTGSVEDSGGTYPVDEEYNGVYTNTGTTKTVSYPDYNTGSTVTVTAPVYYNGARYLFLTDYQNQPTWAVGTTSSSMEYVCTSTGSELSSIIGTNEWLYGGMYSSIQITASWTDEGQSHGGSTPAVTTFTLTVNYSDTAPSGAKWIVSGVEHEFGSSVELEAGTYTITYKAVSGYTTPSSQSVTGAAGETKTVLANAYVANTPSTTYPNAFVVTGTNYAGNSLTDPAYSTATLAKVTGTYVKTGTNIYYNGNAYPTYFNGYYYMWKSQSDGYVALDTVLTPNTQGLQCAYSNRTNGSSADMTSSSLGGTWAPSSPMPEHVLTLTFTDSTATDPVVGTLQYQPVDTSQPYLSVENSSDLVRSGNYYLYSGSLGSTNTVWKHETRNYFILNHDGETWCICDSTTYNSSSYVDLAISSSGELGPAEIVFEGGLQEGNYLTTYHSNQSSASTPYIHVTGNSTSRYDGDYYLTSGSLNDNTAVFTNSSNSAYVIKNTTYWDLYNNSTYIERIMYDADPPSTWSSHWDYGNYSYDFYNS